MSTQWAATSSRGVSLVPGWSPSLAVSMFGPAWAQKRQSRYCRASWARTVHRPVSFSLGHQGHALLPSSLQFIPAPCMPLGDGEVQGRGHFLRLLFTNVVCLNTGSPRPEVPHLCSPHGNAFPWLLGSLGEVNKRGRRVQRDPIPPDQE